MKTRSLEAERRSYEDVDCERFEDLEADILTRSDDPRYAEIKSYFELLDLWDQNSRRELDFIPYGENLSEETQRLLQHRYGITEDRFKWFHRHVMSERFCANAKRENEVLNAKIAHRRQEIIIPWFREASRRYLEPIWHEQDIANNLTRIYMERHGRLMAMLDRGIDQRQGIVV